MCIAFNEHIFCLKTAIVAMVGERLVSACGWDGGATMRSVAATVREVSVSFVDCQLSLVFRVVAPISGQYFTIQRVAAV
jgi:hypothetical protein